MRTKQKNRKKSGINFTTIDSGLPKKSRAVKGDTKKPLNPTPMKSSVELLDGSVSDDMELNYALSSADITILLKLKYD